MKTFKVHFLSNGIPTKKNFEWSLGTCKNSYQLNVTGRKLMPNPNESCGYETPSLRRYIALQCLPMSVSLFMFVLRHLNSIWKKNINKSHFFRVIYTMVNTLIVKFV